jgi:eukaryotic-like serine/threonine-protein kinase
MLLAEQPHPRAAVPYALDPGALVAALSGVALAVLGFGALQLRPRNPSSLAFSAFAILWGAAVIAGNLFGMALAGGDDGATAPWRYLFVLLYIPLYVPLLYFAGTHPWPSGPLARTPFALGLFALPAAGVVLLLMAAPSLFLPPGARGPFGPLTDPVLLWNSFIAFVAALALAGRALQRAVTPTAREQLTLLVAALLAYVAYRTGDVAGRRLFVPDTASPQLDILGLGTYGVLVLAAAAVSLGVLRGALRRSDVPWHGLLVACATLPAAFSLLETVLRAGGITAFNTVGLWRLAAVALLAYGIARYRMFDVEVRLRAAAPVGTFLAAAVVGVSALWMLAGGAFARAPFLGVAASVGVAAVCVPLARAGRVAWARAAPQVDEPDYLYKRKLDVYRAALEEAHPGGSLEETEQAFLSDLRRRLGITSQEHRVLLLMLQSQTRPAKQPVGGPRFRVLRELGQGSFGRAVLARDTVLDREVVLKQPLVPWVLEPEGRARFLQEAKLAAHVLHPNVVAVYEVLPDEEPPTLIMEYVPGGTLEDLLARRGRLDPEEAARILLDVLAGLERIHRAGIVHRDLKPANILLAADGTAKVTDFGIARPPPELAAAATLASPTSGSPGSLAYMSPEQARGVVLDGRSDIYAVGTVLYRMLAGDHPLPLAGMSDSRLRDALQKDPPRPLPASVPPALAAVVLRALAKEPAARFPTAFAMAAAVREAGGTEGRPARGAASGEPTRRASPERS